MIKSGIYMIVERINGRSYIGSSVNVFTRWRKHKWQLNKGIHHNKYLQRAWDKYGYENFDFAFIEPVEDIRILRGREQVWINVVTNIFKSPVTLFNGVLQVENGNFLLRKTQMVSDERKRRLSEQMKGNKYAIGKSHAHPIEIRNKISEKLKGTRHSEESYKRQSEKIKGRKHSQEARDNMRASQQARRTKEKNS